MSTPTPGIGSRRRSPLPGTRASFDAGLLAAGLSDARRTGSDRLVGAGAGLGAEVSFRMVHGEDWGQLSAELLHLETFARFEPMGRWQYDVGVRAAVDMHSRAVHFQSGSESELGGFLGGYIEPMWGWRQFRFGPRIQAGAYWDPDLTFGIGITPLTARFLFKF